jgi:hypothetical protein
VRAKLKQAVVLSVAMTDKKESTTKANGVQLASFGTDEIALRGRRSIRFSLLVPTR